MEMIINLLGYFCNVKKPMSTSIQESRKRQENSWTFFSVKEKCKDLLSQIHTRGRAVHFQFFMKEKVAP